MRLLSVLAAAAVLLAFCSLSRSKSIKVAAFNIQIFGQSKYRKPGVVPILVKIVRRYDLVFIQEIRDKSETVIFNFVRAVNSAEGRAAFAVHVSRRLGRTSSKEQYAYMYRTDAIRIDAVSVANGFINNFERPPYVALVTVLNQNRGCSSFSFLAIGAHIKPGRVHVVNELNSMVKVYEAAQRHFRMDRALLMGDFNAGCGYLSKTNYRHLKLTTDRRFKWLINQDSTVAKSWCAYDRFVAAGGLEEYVSGRPSVYYFNTTMGLSRQQAKKVSDHFPIELVLDDSLRNRKRSRPAVGNAGVTVAEGYAII
uniref:Deoxyribonuclease n=1 Tax=Halisarca dujardinii TaxID=2583056 RepID=A0AA96MLR5_HALDU|nr:deoxyribonuclease-I-like protein [Halisarca dujardinii]